MARTTASPVVDHTRLLQPDRALEAIPVGSPAWFAWLARATSFAFSGEGGSFTAYKERRTPTREYWKAYRRRAGRLHRAYLGKSAELTLERLNAVAAELAGTATSALPPAGEPGAGGGDLGMADEARSLHLLATKLMIPTPHPNSVPRSRLIEQLDAAIRQGRKLVLLSAPAGFGKTTLVANWLAQAQSAERRAQRDGEDSGYRLERSDALSLQRFAWLSLDDTDDHLGQFLAYLIAALEAVRPGVGADAWPLLRAQAAHPPAQAILTILMNALAEAAGAIVLVLDDYHTITRQPIHEAVAFLLDRMPPQLRLIITCRADPSLSLARLRVRQQFTEIRAADLRFTRDEAADFFDRAHGISLPADAVATLQTRTEGWAAGLQLAALSLQQQEAAHIPAFVDDFTGSNAYVFDYLAEEVFQRQPAATQVFLLQTAILARLCGPLCAAVTSHEGAQALLERLEQANLFLIPLDSRRRWYRYHQLFQDFLRERLERTAGPAGCALLHRRASAWFEQHGLAGEAIEHALSAQAWEDALRCLAPLMAEQRFYEYFLDWPRWVAALPDRALRAAPELCLGCARILILTGHIEAAQRPLQLAEAVWRAADDRQQLSQLLGYSALALALRREFSHAKALAQQALAMLPAELTEQHGVAAYTLGYSMSWLGQAGRAADWLGAVHGSLQHAKDVLLVEAVTAGMARALQLQGQLRRAAGLYQDVIRRTSGATHYELPMAYFYLGRLYYEWDDLASAERALHEGIAVGQRTGRGRFWPSAYAALAWVRWARGDTTESALLMERALAAAHALNSPPSIAEVQARQAGLWLVQGDLEAAARWLAGRALDADARVPYEYQAEYLVLARVRIAQAWRAPGGVDLGVVVRLLERLLRRARADERGSDQITLLALLALTYAAKGEPDQAQASLAPALALAEPEGHTRTFVDEGPPMRTLLLALREQAPGDEGAARLRSYIERLLGAFPAAAAGPPPPPALLSERERTILQLLAGGSSLQEVAGLLIISVHTARTHVKNIYAKLEVHNRVQAIERARALRLL